MHAYWFESLVAMEVKSIISRYARLTTNAPWLVTNTQRSWTKFHVSQTDGQTDKAGWKMLCVSGCPTDPAKWGLLLKYFILFLVIFTEMRHFNKFLQYRNVQRQYLSHFFQHKNCISWLHPTVHNIPVFHGIIFLFSCSSRIGQNKIFEQNKIFFRPTYPDFAQPLRNRKHTIYFVWPK